MKISVDTIELEVKGADFSLTIDGEHWHSLASSLSRIVFKNEEILYFKDIKNIEHSLYQSGVGKGICTRYTDNRFAFETLIWIEYATHHIYFEWIPIDENQVDIAQVYFPEALTFDENKEDHYTLINLRQGQLIPNTWTPAIAPLPFNGMFNSAAAYMPWFAQVKKDKGYIAIAVTDSDAGYWIDHPENAGYSHIGMYHLECLGKMRYRRVVRYTFLSSITYNDLCKVYRQYAIETGKLTTLKEKAVRNPLVDKLIGAAFVHKGIKTHVEEESEFYDLEDPTKNDILIPFAVRQKEIEQYHQAGIQKLYFHLDGWGQPGYDNQHPDYLPACQEAGGWEGLKALSDTMQKYGYMLGLHDQYRDYYFKAKTFDKEFALTYEDGSIFEMTRWAGGHQSYLCASQAKYYVRRNFQEVLNHGIHLEGSYLDVFTCNEPDQCFHVRHKMTRKECLDYRNACFDYLTSLHILPSSEEVSDFSMRSLVFCHYGPYTYMLSKPGSIHQGIEVPLFNLVYHDCLIIPWYMDEVEGEVDSMLYALLNGGAAYLDKDGAYPNIDGAFFDDQYQKELEHKKERYQIVAAFQEKVAKEEMVKHEFIDGDYTKQKTTFANGMSVEIDLKKNTYKINEL